MKKAVAAVLAVTVAPNQAMFFNDMIREKIEMLRGSNLRNVDPRCLAMADPETGVNPCMGFEQENGQPWCLSMQIPMDMCLECSVCGCAWAGDVWVDEDHTQLEVPAQCVQQDS